MTKNVDKIQIPTLVFIPDFDYRVYSSQAIALVEKIGEDRAILVGPIEKSYHGLLEERGDVLNPLLNSVCEFALLGKNECISQSLKDTLKTIPMSKLKLDKSVRVPPGHRTGWFPSRIPKVIFCKKKKHVTKKNER